MENVFSVNSVGDEMTAGLLCQPDCNWVHAWLQMASFDCKNRIMTVNIKQSNVMDVSREQVLGLEGIDNERAPGLICLPDCNWV